MINPSTSSNLHNLCVVRPDYLLDVAFDALALLNASAINVSALCRAHYDRIRSAIEKLT